MRSQLALTCAHPPVYVSGTPPLPLPPEEEAAPLPLLPPPAPLDVYSTLQMWSEPAEEAEATEASSSTWEKEEERTCCESETPGIYPPPPSPALSMPPTPYLTSPHYTHVFHAPLSVLYI